MKESDILARDEELKTNYPEILVKIQSKIKDLPNEEKTQIINEEIRNWTSPFWQLLDDSDFDIPRGIKIAALMKARKENPAFHHFIKELYTLLWEKESAGKIVWNKSQKELVFFVKKLQERGLIVMEDKSIYRYIVNHFVPSKGNPYTVETLKKSAQQTMNREQEDSINSLFGE